MVDGNIAITGKHSLRVSRDAAASAGGSDTVNVYLKNAESVVAVEATLKVSAANFNFAAGDVIFNSELFTGNAVTDPVVTVTDSTITVLGLPQGRWTAFRPRTTSGCCSRWCWMSMPPPLAGMTR